MPCRRRVTRARSRDQRRGDVRVDVQGLRIVLAGGSARRGRRCVLPGPLRRGARPGRGVGLGQDHRGPCPARPRPPRTRGGGRESTARRDRPAAGVGRSDLQAARGAEVVYVPQDPASALNPTLRIGTQLREVLRYHARCWRPRASATRRRGWSRHCEEVGLGTIPPACCTAYPHQLSGGQQQRVVLAMAFACGRSLIVLDEPTTGLDVSTQRHVLDTVRASLPLLRGGGGLRHPRPRRRRRAGRRTWRSCTPGRIVEIGTTAEVFGRPAPSVHPRAAAAAIPSPERSEVLTGIDGQPPRPGPPAAGVRLRPALRRWPMRLPAATAPARS